MSGEGFESCIPAQADADADDDIEVDADADADGSASNSALYWAAQMIGGFLIGAVCDFPWLSRPKRALLAWTFVFIFGNAVMGGGLAFENLREAHPADWIVFQSSEYAGPAVLYFFYGMLDALWQGVSGGGSDPDFSDLSNMIFHPSKEALMSPSSCRSVVLSFCRAGTDASV